MGIAFARAPHARRRTPFSVIAIATVPGSDRACGAQRQMALSADRGRARSQQIERRCLRRAVFVSPTGWSNPGRPSDQLWRF